MRGQLPQGLRPDQRYVALPTTVGTMTKVAHLARAVRARLRTPRVARKRSRARCSTRQYGRIRARQLAPRLVVRAWRESHALDSSDRVVDTRVLAQPHRVLTHGWIAFAFHAEHEHTFSEMQC